VRNKGEIEKGNRRRTKRKGSKREAKEGEKGMMKYSNGKSEKGE
jgi:hypothetical protein